MFALYSHKASGALEQEHMFDLFFFFFLMKADVLGQGRYPEAIG